MVLLECGHASARWPHREDIVAFRKELHAYGDLIVPTMADEDSAWCDFAADLWGSAGIVGHISFAVMRRLGIAEAFSNDRHFVAAGFTVLF